MYSSAQSQVFACAELVEMILEALPSPSRRKNILAVALSTKGLHYIAIAVLWRTLPKISPLSALISSLENLDRSSFSTVVVASRDASAVGKYCRYVRHLDLKELEEPFMVSKFMILLYQYRQNYIAFPILRTLSVCVDKLIPGALTMLGLSLSRSLPKVTLSGIDRNNQSDVVKYLARHSSYPQAKGCSLTLKGMFIVDVLRALKGAYVETLTMDAPIGAPQAVLGVVSEIHGLRNMSIIHRNESVDTSDASSLPSAPFRNSIHRLAIAGHAAQIFAYLENMAGMEMLSSLCLQFALPMRDQHEKVAEFSLQERCILSAANSAPSVESLEISDDDGTIGPFEWNALTHVSKWKSLKHLDVNIYRAALGARTARTRRPWHFKGWESLETLRVHVYHWSVRVARPFKDFLALQLSPLDLRGIADCCPRLRSLRITLALPLTVPVLAAMKQALPAGVVQRRTRQKPAPAHGLQELTIWVFTRTYEDEPVPLDAQVREGHGAVFAQYLGLAFPQLEDVRFVATDPEGRNEPHPHSLQWCEALEGMVVEYRQHQANK
ncbi:hypothetical protein HYPSUDRAFT_41845 [Hypholoma sublateritium FD-334 SS-4]|uniref:F-box domain-containing protein n=1 Tax=Hypholoma sublateritium (strain FD-334 SS-4) TaxID=945553 RepID=A0A0D2MDV6_HYPSF|nr:hypothetical protein HYPSUDRAFT_41845 [Hypholoma sublateritium FD-334 SS-4]